MFVDAVFGLLGALVFCAMALAFKILHDQTDIVLCVLAIDALQLLR